MLISVIYGFSALQKKILIDKKLEEISNVNIANLTTSMQLSLIKSFNFLLQCHEQ